MATKTKKKSERWELLTRIFVAIVTGIILSVWKIAIIVVWIIQFIIVLFKGKRNKNMAEFSEVWNTQNYIFIRYLIFESNQRPFPFTSLEKNMSKFE